MKNLIGSDDVAIVASQSLKEKTYWLNKLSGELQKITFPYDWKKTGKPEHRFNTIKFSLNDDLFSSLIKLGNNSDARLHMIMVAGLAVLLSKYTGARDIIVGTSIYQQDIEANFVNTVLPLRFQLDDKMGFKHLLLQVRETIFEAVENQNYPYESLLNELNLKFSGDECPLFETAVLMENIQDKEYLKQVKPNITLVFLRTADSLEGQLEYNSRLYEKNTMERVITHFTRLLDKAVFNLESALSALELLSPEEKYQLVHTFNNTEAAYPKESTIYELFEECANKLPHHTAVIHEDQRVTYKELNERSNQLARIVKGKGIKPDSIAALLVDRSIEMMVGILGILKAGGAYLPIDTDSAENRIRFMLEDSGVKLLLTKKDTAKKVGIGPGRETIFLDEIALYQGDNTNLEKINNPRDLVYMIYTSGTTGNPRGVMIEHQGLVNYIYWASKTYVKHERLNFPLYTSISFDLTVTSVFTPLITGNSVVVYGSDDNFLLIEKIIDEQKVEVIKLTPSHLKLIKNKEIKNSPIKRLIVGGEDLEVQLARDITGNFQENIEIFNEYGPTETVVGSMIYKFNRETDNRSSVPIGGPIDNTRVYVLDSNLKPVALGSIGEIYVSGHGVARGYFGDEALTTEKFIENPFIPGERMYRTGDKGRFQEDRNIDFLGRRDQQVKIRGFRVELGEIETKLKNFKKIPFTTILDDDLAHISPIYKKNLRYCTRCMLSSDYPGINFDENGICNLCRQYDTFAKPLEKYFKQKDDFLRLVEQAREEKPGEYDCLLLFSGGKDSSYVLYQLVEMGLKVLTFTFDNGYISDTAFDNIKRITSELEVENVVVTSPHMNKVFVESLKSDHNACHGCWNALNAIGTKVAHEKGINMIISGLSRGQIYDMRLQGLFQMGTFDEEEIEEKLVLFRKTFHSRDNKFARLLKVEINENILKKIYFVDFFRYFNASVEEIKTYLLKNGWVRPKDTGFCSSNCMINDVGIYIHLRERNYHFYSEQLSWDCRLGSITREEGLKEIDFEVDLPNVDRILNEIGYFHSAPVKDSIVVDKEDKNGDKYLCAYLVSDDELSVSELREYLFGILPGYMIPSYFLQIDKIPMTAHGKVDRRSLPEPEFKSGREYTAPRDNVEKNFVEIWSDILGIEKEIIGIDRHFFEMGGHSLNATMLVSRIHKEFNVKISLVDIFKNPSIRGISELIRKSKEDKFSSIKSVEKKDFYPLSSAQKRLYILQQFGTDNTGYNMPFVIPLRESFKKEKLESVFKRLIERHESLRTSFITVNQEPFQRIHREVDFSIGCYEIREEAGANSPISDFIKPFNLDTAPLLRVNLISVGSSRRVLFIDMHHIITDGTSENKLQKEFLALHEGKYLLPLRVQYKDFAQWQNGEKEKKNLKRQEEYWLKEFEGEIPVLELPTDFPRPVEQSFEGDSINFEITRDETRGLNAMALTGGYTLFMVLTAVVNILLFKLSGQEDIIIGTPIAGRRHTDLDKIMGMFVNTLVLRNYPVGDRRFRDFLGEVKERMLTVFENQEYPFEEFVNKLAVKRDIGRNPLFDIMFVLQNMYTSSAGQDEKTEIENSQLFQLDSPNENENIVRPAKFDLTLIAVEIDTRLFLSFEYCTKLFKKETIERFIIYFKKIVSIVVNDPGIRLDEIIVISEEEKNRLLYEFNNTEADYPKDKTIHDLFAEQVGRTPDRVALMGPKSQIPGPRSQTDKITFRQTNLFSENNSITYRELNKETDQLAHLLKEKGVDTNCIVAVMIERCLNLPVVMLSILKAGGAYLPIDPGYPAERQKYILEDSAAKILVTTGLLPGEDEKVRRWEGEKIFLDSYYCPGRGEVSSPASHQDFVLVSAYPPPPSTLTSTSTCQVSPANLVYVIYTSGSTGKPKGVPVIHTGFVNLVNFHQKAFGVVPADRMSQVAGPGFDAMAFEVWPCLLSGATLIIANDEIRSNAGKIKEWLIKNQVTISFQPTVIAEQLIMEKWPPRGAALKSLRTAGEQLTKYPAFQLPFRFYNLYGPTEDTVWTTWARVGVKTSQADKKYPSIGNPIANHRVYVMGNQGKLQPVNIGGELCIAGDGLAEGYLNQPEKTAEKFVENPYIPGERMYKSGDLARWLTQGNIEFLGRIDHQVKIRGFRIELGEIENHLLKYEEINEAVVVVKSDETGDKHLCAYIVVGKEFSVSQSREFLSRKLPDYMIPNFFMEIDHIPLNQNGKIDRKALPEPEIREPGENHAAAKNWVEHKLAEIWSEVLGIKKDKISMLSNFFDLGGHSLRATTLISKINKELNIRLPLVEIFRTPTIRGLSEYVKDASEYRYASIQPAEKKEYYSLSSMQNRLFILQQMDLENTVYNISQVVEIEEMIEEKRLQDTIGKLTRRHESLRTFFEMVNNEPVQRIHGEIEFEIESYDLTTEDPERKNYKLKNTNKEERTNTAHYPDPKSQELKTKNFISSFIRPFDLSRVPLFRVGVIKSSGQKYILMVDMHHIISDGVSNNILIQDFNSLYAGEELPPLKLQYKDYSECLNDPKQVEVAKKQEDFWMKEFEEEIPVIDLPIDYPRPAVQNFQGNRLFFNLGIEETKTLNNLAKSEDATLFMTLMAIFNILLSKICNQEDIIIGSPIAGRRHNDLEQIIGFFVNTLALRNFPTGEKTFREFLQDVKARTLNAFENQEYQFEDLVEKVSVKRDTSRNPLFDTMLVLQNMRIQSNDMPVVDSSQLKIRPYENEYRTAKFDLTLTCFEAGEKLFCAFEYCTKLFKKDTIERFISYFKLILQYVLENRHQKISRIEIITPEEKQQILYDFNDTATPYPKNKPLHQLFEEQVEQTPDNIAVIGEMQSAERKGQSIEWNKEPHAPCAMRCALTYRKLNEKSNQLAHFLIEKGVKPDTIVAIMVERSLEMIIGILGILKSGSAYLPFDPDYPQERVDFMLKDSNAKVLLSEVSEVSGEIEVVKVSELSEQLPTHPTHLTHLCYIIYTSGTTGKPKGVMVEQSSVVNLLFALHCRYPLTKWDTYLLKTSYLFDVSITELFGWFLEGGRLAVLEAGGEKDPAAILAMIARERVTHINFVPSMFHTFVEILDPHGIAELSCLKYIFLAGEALLPSMVDPFRRLNTSIAVENIYGPTEAAVYSSWYSLSDWQDRKPIPIGKPLPNVTLFILDNWGNLQPVGVPGELCIAGAGLARGYLNLPELTEEKFDHDLWDYLDYQDKKYMSLEGTRGFSPLSDKNHLQPCSHTTIPIPHYPITPLPHFPIYRTGDLARWLIDGNIEFLGRIDHQVKIRGFRIELGEIESQLLKYEEINETVVVVKKDETGDKHLCAYIVSSKEFNMSQLRGFLSGKLPDYMVPAYFVSLEKIPLTPNGKVDRKALTELESAITTEAYVPPRNYIEKKLVQIWSEVLAIEETKISTNANFFLLGGHSLRATIMISKIQKELKVKIPLAEIFKISNIRDLAANIKQTQKEKFIAVEAMEKKEYYSLSHAQKRLFFLHQLLPGTTGYNLTSVIPLTENIANVRLGQIFKELLTRHESLRTSFEMIAEEPVQKIHKEVDFSIDCYNSTETETGSLAANFIRLFDLNRAPLLRVSLVNIENSRQVLLLDMHHIITDGTSQRILQQEFMDLYRGEKLAPLRIQYRDFTQWQHSSHWKELTGEQKTYWLKVFSDEVPVLQLPSDCPRPLMQSFDGNNLEFALNVKEVSILKTIARENNITLYMCLLAVFNILFSKLSGDEDIVLGTPIAARRHADLQNVVGMMVNTLAMRNYPSAHKPFKKFLKEVKQRTLDSYENQEYPFETLVDDILPQRDTSRNPVFDVMFNLLNQADYSGAANFSNIYEFTSHSYKHTTGTSRFDIIFSALDLDDYIYFMVEYSTRLFAPATIDRFINYFRNIITCLPGKTDSLLTHIQMISQKEKNEILSRLSPGVEEMDSVDKTIARLFEEQVEKTPNHIAVIDPDLGYISYEKLNQKSNPLAHLLRDKGIGPNSVVGLMIERSINMIIGIIAILKAGGAYLPIDTELPEERILTILSDSRVSTLLTQLVNHEKYHQCIGLDEISDQIKQYSTGNPVHMNRIEDLLYVIYTSGSTGIPKGVILEHRNLVNLIRYQYNYTDIDFSRVLQFTTISFDVSAQEIFSTLLAGGRLSLVSKDTLADIPELFKMVEKVHIKTLFLPTSFLKFVIGEEDFLRLIPVSVKHIVTAGEQMIVNERFNRYLKEKDVCFHNHYGPSETHVVTAFTVRPGEDTAELPPIGRPVLNTWIYLLDKGSQPVPVGVPGELFIGGLQVGRGYLNNPELTSQKFQIPNSKFQTKRSPSGLILNAFGVDLAAGDAGNSTHSTIYRTGDLARWLADSNIEFLGRIDHQVKVRGFRVELGEIESRLMNHPGIKDTVVQARAAETGEKYLCAYIVAHDTEFSVSELREYLSKQLPEYIIPAHFVWMDELPLTPNRKIDRRRLPGPSLEEGGEHIAPRNEIEEKMAKIWAETMELDKNIISIDGNFFEMGGHSLRATVMTAKIHKELNVKLPLAEVFNTPTIRGLSRYISGLNEHRFLSIRPTEKKEYYRLSSAQKRLYILKDMDDQGVNYNLPYAAILEGNADKRKLEDTFKSLIERHESLRTSFHMISDEPVQRIHKYDEVGFMIEYYELEKPYTSHYIGDTDTENNIHHSLFNIRRFVRPFDLAQAPLLRVYLLHYPAIQHPITSQVEKVNDRHILIIDMHHIISDGVSIGLLLREFMLLYGGEKLQGLSLQYKDFSEWQCSRQKKETIKKQEEYWLNEFGGEIPVLDLPVDFKRPIIQSFEGGTLNFNIGKEDTKALKKYALMEKTTLFTVLLAAYNIFLSKISSQEDMVVGTPVAGRQHSDMEHIVGMFVNTLPLRNFPGGEKTINQFINEVKDRTLEAFDNQDYQYEDLVDKTVTTRNAGRNPLFDTMFSWQNFDIPGMDIPGLNLKPYIFELEITRFDLILRSVEIEDRLEFTLDYSKKLFKVCTIERFISYFKKVISAVIENLTGKISNIEIISEDERTQILNVFNDTGAEYPGDMTIQQLFEEQVEKTPDNIAAAALEKSSYREGHRVRIQYLTYIELKTRTNRLASILKSKGIGAGSIVTIMTEPFVNMIIGILAVLKAGSCYLPLSPQNPENRITYILKDSETRLLLTQSGMLRQMSIGVEVLYIDNESLYKETGENFPDNICKPSDPIYMIYTSGTTGKPKGVIIKHENLVNYVTWFSRETGLTGEDRTVLTSSFAFDLGYTSLYSSVLKGGQLHILPREIYMVPEIFLDYIHRHRITYIKVTPSFFTMIAANPNFSNKSCEMLRLVVLGGEAINVEDVEKMHYICPHIKVMNHYGPTEVTIGSIAQFIDFHRFDEYKAGPTIGRPISNTKAFILDKFFKLLPVGIAGELCLSGAGVAKGYFKRARLNSERFISNVFMEEGAVIKPYDRVYRTGDLARWMPDGNIEFLGRIDSQVKIRGFRVELGEIESQLLNHPAIKETVVMTRAVQNQDNYLCAYINSNKKMTASEFREYLSKRLPDYMVPSYFVFLESIPLTPNGKVDRKALPDPGWKAGDEYRAPKNEMEKRLVEMWSKVLEIPADIIGIESNFFELGGHSLKATIFITQVGRELNIRLPLTEVFKTPTIRQLAEYIVNESEEGLSSTDDYLVLLKKKSPTAKHLFFIHDGSGEVEGYMEFCHHLNIEFNCWGIRADVIKNYTPHYASIEEIATGYVEKIKKVQPHGPYYIAGWSLGGTFAFEIILQLEKIGEEVSFLGLIDSPGPESNQGEEKNSFSLESEIDWVWEYLPDNDIKEKVREANDINEIWNIILAHLEENHLNVEFIKQLIPGHMAQIIPNYNQLGIKELIYYLNLNRTLSNARSFYIPSQNINTIIHFFKASQSPVEQSSWNDYCIKPIKSYEIPGDHFTVFKEPNVVQSAKIVKKVLNKMI